MVETPECGVHHLVVWISHDGSMSPRRAVLVTAAAAIVAAISLLILALFLSSQGLDRASAWSNIIAVPLTVVGIITGLRGVRRHREREGLPRRAARVQNAGTHSGPAAVVQYGAA